MINRVRSVVTGIYFFLIFLVFPLYVEDHYWEMGDCKMKFYFCTTVVYLAVMLVIEMVRGVRGEWDTRNPSVCDWCTIIYGICVILTFLAAEDRAAVLKGEEEWYMGAAAQLMFLATYFVVSRSRIPVRIFVWCNALGSGVCFLLGILQRLGFDVLHMYEGLADILLSDYLSTVGNRTWMSGYVCAVCPIGIYLFWQAQGRRQRLLWGSYSALAFAGLVATYSDSVYVGVGVVFFALGIMSIGNLERVRSFLWLLCIWFGQALFMCGLRALCGEQVRDARGLTCEMYKWQLMLAGFVMCLAMLTWAIYFPRRMAGRRADSQAKTALSASRIRRIRRRCLAATAIAGVLVVLLIALNTAGLLERWFGFSIHNKYLCFDETWGDMRGWTWRMTCQMFGGLPLSRKLFGVGADSFGYHAYGIPEYAEAFRMVWGNVRLTNAHNEWLNMIFCQGIVGGLAYLGIFASGAAGCLFYGEGQSEDDGESPMDAEGTGRIRQTLVAGIGLCLLAYMGHNFFCYQQVCATGPIFVLLGIGVSLVRETLPEMSEGR
ncbi:MAG: O-antigen ligase family protein [Butyrivibrio sp.]|nr:O-antigen ligase family protein [Muribaculum sp.]MCM1551125.1 O-antigen ligase family protein [Butyrivibrio sp.]